MSSGGREERAKNRNLWSIYERPLLLKKKKKIKRKKKNNAEEKGGRRRDSEGKVDAELLVHGGHRPAASCR